MGHMTEWCVKTETHDLPGSPLIQIYIVAVADIGAAMMKVSNFVDSSVVVTAVGPVSAKAITLWKLAPGAFINVTT